MTHHDWPETDRSGPATYTPLGRAIAAFWLSVGMLLNALFG